MWERPPYAVCSAMRILPTCTSPSSCRNWPPQARVVMRLFNTSLTGPVRGMLGDVAVLSSTELAAPAFVEAALRGSVGFELRAGDRQVAVQEVDSGHPDLWLALAEAESAEGEPAIFPVDAPRVV